MDIKKLAQAIKQKNQSEIDIARIIGEPSGGLLPAEYVAAEIFNISLHKSVWPVDTVGQLANEKLDGKSVYIRWDAWYSSNDVMVDLLNRKSLPDFYLIMTGPKSSGRLPIQIARPWLIAYVFLFDTAKLVGELKHVVNQRNGTLFEPNTLA